MESDTVSPAPFPAATAFAGQQIIASGTLDTVALAARLHSETHPDASILVFDDATGRVIDLDLRGSDAEIVSRLTRETPLAPAPTGRGRPRLGVVSREVTLLPRHWEWLAAQPGGASNTLRRLVDRARREEEAPAHQRARREAAYRFMSAMAGDLPRFEAASRALFGGDAGGLDREMGGWPPDVRRHVIRLLGDSAAAG